jgi:hypothetical protein
MSSWRSKKKELLKAMTTTTSWAGKARLFEKRQINHNKWTEKPRKEENQSYYWRIPDWAEKQEMSSPFSLDSLMLWQVPTDGNSTPLMPE